MKRSIKILASLALFAAIVMVLIRFADQRGPEPKASEAPAITASTTKR